MAAGPSALSPPPGMGGSASDAPQSPTSPAVASPAPAQSSPMMDQGASLMVGVTRGLQTIAQQFPAASPEISQINDLMRQVMAKMMMSQQGGEPAAPPMPG